MSLAATAKQTWTVLRILSAMHRYNRTGDLQSALRFDLLTEHLDIANEQLRRLSADPASAQMIANRYLDIGIDMERFRKLPQDTLGHAFAACMDRQGLDPEEVQPPLEGIDTDKRYVLIRLRQCHDVYHLVTGFDMSYTGEVGLQGYTLAQFHSPTSAIAITAICLNMMREHFREGELDEQMTALSRGWLMGQDSKPIFGVDWVQWWDRPIHEIREHLGLGRQRAAA